MKQLNLGLFVFVFLFTLFFSMSLKNLHAQTISTGPATGATYPPGATGTTIPSTGGTAATQGGVGATTDVWSSMRPIDCIAADRQLCGIDAANYCRRNPLADTCVRIQSTLILPSSTLTR